MTRGKIPKVESSTDVLLNGQLVRSGSNIPLIPALEKNKQADCYDFEAILVYIVSPRKASAI